MTVYVDDMRLPVRTGQHEVHWSQLLADSEIELHVFAARLGLGRRRRRDRLPEPGTGGAYPSPARGDTCAGGLTCRRGHRPHEKR